MKITESHLRVIIKEELKGLLNEVGPVMDFTPPSAYVQTADPEFIARMQQGEQAILSQVDGEKIKKVLTDKLTFKKINDNEVMVTDKTTNKTATIDLNNLRVKQGHSQSYRPPGSSTRTIYVPAPAKQEIQKLKNLNQEVKNVIEAEQAKNEQQVMTIIFSTILVGLASAYGAAIVADKRQGK